MAKVEQTSQFIYKICASLACKPESDCVVRKAKEQQQQQAGRDSREWSAKDRKISLPEVRVISLLFFSHARRGASGAS